MEGAAVTTSGRAMLKRSSLMLLIVLINNVSDSTAASVSSNLRAKKEEEFERMHVIRRVYGEHNADVRRHVSMLEERMDRYQTGLPGDPNHKVPYKNHPYDKENRMLQEEEEEEDGGDEEDPEVMVADANLFQPMRIQFFTEALDSVDDGVGGAKISWYKNQVLPKTAEFWTQALSVVPVQGPLTITESELDSRIYCGDSEFTAIPDAHKTDGVQNADVLLYVSGSNDPRFCPERTLAVAVPCNFDQFDRPTAGAINVCLDNIILAGDGSSSDAVVQDYVDVTIHEVGHVFGHSSNSYRFFWDPVTGEPRTPRPFSATTVTCVNGEESTLIVPAENTMVFVDTDNGNRYASIVTDKVKTIARNQFDCQDLEGARLEHLPTRSDSCTGDHWDERLFYPEALSGVISPTTNIFSSLTLALLEDSGWYRANYTVSHMSPWGLGGGCEFLNSPCLEPGGEDGIPIIPEYGRGFFCNQEGHKGCSPELTHKLACTVVDYFYYVPQELPPVEFQYFSAATSKGGPKQGDYCPVYGSPYGTQSIDNLDCKAEGNSPSFNLYSEVYGADSQCIPSTSATSDEGLCYRTACVQDEMKLRINVIGEWHTCESDFQEIEVVVGQGIFPTTLTCPPLSQACPDLFCPFNCAGRGVCNYSATVNGTVRPKCECFDELDTSAGCSDSLVPDGAFLDDSSGLFNNAEENFFDPLVAVFVDNPETWSTASWAWAAGLLTIFLVMLLCICSSLWPKRSRKYA